MLSSLFFADQQDCTWLLEGFQYNVEALPPSFVLKVNFGRCMNGTVGSRQCIEYAFFPCSGKNLGCIMVQDRTS